MRMRYRRIILIDIASLGLGDIFGHRANTLGHLDQHFHSNLKLPTLTSLGLGNICADHPIKSVPAVEHPRGFFSSLHSYVNENSPSAGIREMLDVDLHDRVVGVLNELVHRNFSVTVIAPLVNYLIDQDWAKQIIAADDDQSYERLVSDLHDIDEGMIYFQPPVIQSTAIKHQMRGYKANLEVMDKQLGILFDKLLPTDMVIITSSFANDPTLKELYTREKLPLIIYTPHDQNGKSIGRIHKTSDIGATIMDNFKRHTKMQFSDSLLPLL